MSVMRTERTQELQRSPAFKKARTKLPTLAATAAILLATILPAAAPSRSGKGASGEGRAGAIAAGEGLNSLLQKAITALTMMRKGEREAAAEAEDALNKAMEMAPDDPRVLTYHGSLLILKGRDAKLPFRKMQLVNSGLREMDRAVRLAPSDIEVRMQRAMHCLALPSIFQRADSAVADFTYLLAWAESHPGAIDDQLRARIGLRLADAYMSKHEKHAAMSALEQVAESFPASKEAAEAEQRLKEMREGKGGN